MSSTPPSRELRWLPDASGRDEKPDQAARAGVQASRRRGHGVDCPAIDGIIEEADEVAGEVDDKNVLDAVLIAAAQAIEHYEMTRYGTLIAWAKQLGRADCAKLLEQNLQEEAADRTRFRAPEAAR
jgi:ferritin-like metal-binding protein YciE